MACKTPLNASETPCTSGHAKRTAIKHALVHLVPMALLAFALIAPASVFGAERHPSLSSLFAPKIEARTNPLSSMTNTAFAEEVLYPSSSASSDELGNVSYAANMQPLLQGDAYPSGCEPAALAAVLRSMGFDATIEDVIGCLNIDPSFTDYVYHYAGDPSGEGSAYAPAMVQAANVYLARQESSFEAIDISGTPFDDMISLVERGYPVMAWCTIDYQEPLFSSYSIYGWSFVRNNHCVVVCGNNGDTLRIMDPLEGIIECDTETFRSLYETRGAMAMVIASTSTQLIVE